MVYCVAALSSIEPELASSGVPLYGVLHESLGAEEFRHGSTLVLPGFLYRSLLAEKRCFQNIFLKVWWPYATLFAFIFLLYKRCHHSSFIPSQILAEAHLHFLTAVVRWAEIRTLASLNKPAHYQLSQNAHNILDAKYFSISH